MTPRRNLLIVPLMLALTLAPAGCARGPVLAPVKGRVTLNGKPLPPCEGRITFHPEKGRLATAPLEADGSFVLTTFQPGDGALVGPHKVTIKATKILGPGQVLKSFEDELEQSRAKAVKEPRVVWIVPARFLEVETSTLTADVENKNNVIDFDVVP